MRELIRKECADSGYFTQDVSRWTLIRQRLKHHPMSPTSAPFPNWSSTQRMRRIEIEACRTINIVIIFFLKASEIIHK